MHKFKVKTGANKVYELNKEVFEEVTKQESLYYTQNKKNESIQFAVCPACDNPIEIIGLYKNLKNTKRPYGRHYPQSITGLATYNQQAYDYCPYSKKQINITIDSRKLKLTEFERSIYNLMREQFDRVVYVLSKQIDIKITNAVAQRMLITYVNGEGWLYPWATLYNLPWVFGHLTWSKPLYGQPILKGTPLYNSIIQNCPAAEFHSSEYYKGYDILLSKKKMFLDINYCIIFHRRSVSNDELTETMDLVVSEGGVDKDKKIYTKRLTIDESYFLNLINLPEEKCFRNTKLLEISKKLMPELM